MQFLDYHENKQHGTYDFPFEFYHVDQNHPQYIMSYHWHSEYEIIRILTGELRVTLDEKTVEAKEGDILFVNGGVLHAAMPAACVYECLVFDLDSFQHSTTVCRTMMQEIADHTILVDDFFPPETAGIHQTVWNIFDTMKERAEGYELSVFGLLYAFLGQIYSTHSYHEDTGSSRRNYKRLTQMRSVLELIESHYHEPLTLPMIANAAGMSPKYFCRFFAAMTHRKPMEYLNHYRIEKACCELSSSDTSVTEIAYDCGFSDLSYFIKTFKRYKGITPGKYKRHPA